ncbi:unnamed protein product, partial [Polarella glacialis]
CQEEQKLVQVGGAGPPLGYNLVFTTASEVPWPPDRRQAAPAQQGMPASFAQVVGVSNAGTKFCTGCGQRMEASGRFCPGCGARQTSLPTEQPTN